MHLKQRIDLLAALPLVFEQEKDTIKAFVGQTFYKNPWFTESNTMMALDAIVKQHLDKAKLLSWAERYDLPQEVEQQFRVGIVMAGNIPLVGFHDFLSVFVAGHKAMIKLSSKDQDLQKMITSFMKELDPAVADYFEYVERLNDADAIIATGSNNSSRYFDYYFGKYPSIIRKSRTSVAVLTGRESEEELDGLAGDIFHYFGLGCRNVSKLYLPRDYDIAPLMHALEKWKETLLNNNKYKNNFDYNLTLQILNRELIIPCDFLIIQEKEALFTAVAQLHYEYYDELHEVLEELDQLQDQVQCRVGHLKRADFTPFGQTQRPGLMQYADDVDTMAFLKTLGTAVV